MYKNYIGERYQERIPFYIKREKGKIDNGKVSMNEKREWIIDGSISLCNRLRPNCKRAKRDWSWNKHKDKTKQSDVFK